MQYIGQTQVNFRKSNFKMTEPSLNISRSMKKGKSLAIQKFFKLSLAILVLSSLTQLVVCCTFTVKGEDYQALLTQKSKLEKDILSLEYENSLLSSLERVEKEATKMGYSPLKTHPLMIETPKLASLD